MRKSLVVAVLTLATLVSACHRKAGGGYLAPTPVPNANATR